MDPPYSHETRMPASTTNSRIRRPVDPALLTKLPYFRTRASSALARADEIRTTRHARVDRDRKATLGQFLTPASAASFAASFFQRPKGPIRLLDAGAGAGALLAACLDRFGAIDAVDAVETDADLLSSLAEALATARGRGARVRLIGDCFLRWGLARPGAGESGYSHAILNPPYRRLPARSEMRDALREAGLDVANLYTAFVALAVERLAPDGELVAILPRSFFSGPMHAAFRQWLLDRAALLRIHAFERRDAVFGEDGVLQEIVMVHLHKGVAQERIFVSTSSDDGFRDLRVAEYERDAVLLPRHPHRCIRIPTQGTPTPLDGWPGFGWILSDLGVSVSTGPVIRSRQIDRLRRADEKAALPLVHTRHHVGPGLAWPAPGDHDDEALSAEAPERLSYSRGHYILVRRYAPKEGARRVMACHLRPQDLPAHALRFSVQDRFSILHVSRSGLSADLAAGLTAYLGTTMVDAHIRTISGTTQINAADLRALPCPSREVLSDLGAWAARQSSWPATAALDDRLDALLRGTAAPAL